MEVGRCAGEGDVDFVAAEVEILVVQGLVDVADEVDEEHEGLVDLRGGELGVLDAGRLWVEKDEVLVGLSYCLRVIGRWEKGHQEG